jgi:arylsulfatase A-like enzyme
VLSIPVVSYHAWLKTSERVSSGIAFKSSVSETNRPNIILVTFDALAARNMSAYGYHKETTPFISEWAKNASVFNMAEAGSNFTTPAVASLMTGKRVWTHQTYHIAGTRPVRSRVESLPATLKESDYFNIALVVNPFASIHALGMSESFDISPPATEFGTAASLFGWKFGIIDKVLYRAFGEKIRLHNWVLKNDFILSRFLNLISRNIYETTVPPERVFDRFINIIDDSPEKPFFAWIHVFPPHDPYLPPEPYEGTLNPSVENRSYKEQERLIEESYTYLFQISSFPETMNISVEVMRDYYDEFIMYIDKEFENFIGELNKRHINNTVIILTSDHGESFEHGYFTHGGPFLYEQVTHIPLVIKETGQGRGQVIRERVEQIDIPATILDLVNIPVPSWMEGRSLVPLLRGGNLPLRPTFSMNFEGNRSRGHQITNGSIAVWEGDYKLIHYLEKGESVLFNIRHDPGELYNVINTEYDIGRRLLGLIQHNLKKANERIFEER